MWRLRQFFLGKTELISENNTKIFNKYNLPSKNCEKSPNKMIIIGYGEKKEFYEIQSMQFNDYLFFQTAATPEDLKAMKATEISRNEDVERIRR